MCRWALDFEPSSLIPCSIPDCAVAIDAMSEKQPLGGEEFSLARPLLVSDNVN
jgi:hypothetical protein